MPQQFLVPCSCGKQLRVSIAQAGEMLRCECGASVTAPTMRGLRKLPLAPPLAEARTKPSWSMPRGVAFSLAMIAMAIGASLLGYHAVQYARKAVYAIDRSGEYAKQESERTLARLETITPIEALAALREMEEEGLGEKPPLLWEVAQEQVKGHRQWMSIGGAAVLSGVVVILAALFVGRK